MRPRALILIALPVGFATVAGAWLALGSSDLPRGGRIALGRRLGQPLSLETLYPGVPWTRLVPQLAPLDGVGGVRAADCGRCHERHYEEWRRSTHAHAFTDLQFQSELAKPSSPRWLCLNCHIPVENQRPARVQALRGGELLRPIEIPNPDFDPALRDEGVTCAVCHLRRDESGKSYVLGSIGGTTPPHPVRVDRQALVRRCDDCHDQSARLTDTLVCHFQSGRELRGGPYAGAKECVSCHLPEERRPLVKPGILAAPIERAAHRHGFVGGGVPKRFELYDAQLGLGFRPALDVEYELLPGAEGQWQVAVRLTNARAGHRAPTGDPERYYLVEVALLDGAGEILGRQRLRIGQLWDWHPVARQRFDNRIAPQEARRFAAVLRPGEFAGLGFPPTPERITSEPPPPSVGTGAAARIRVVVTHVRLATENGDSMQRAAAAAEARFAAAIADLPRHYPFASEIYRSELDLTTGARAVASAEELIARSKAAAAAP